MDKRSHPGRSSNTPSCSDSSEERLRDEQKERLRGRLQAKRKNRV